MPQLFATVNDDYNYMLVSYSYTGPTSVDYYTIEKSVNSGDYELFYETTDPIGDLIDHDVDHGVFYTYRFTGYDSSDNQVISTAHASRTPQFNEWVLKDIDNYDDSEAVQLFIDGSQRFELQNREDISVFNPVGRKYPIVIRDAEIKSDRFSLQLQFLNHAEYEKFDALRQRQKRLKLSGPRPQYNWHGVFAAELSRQIVNDVDGYSLVTIDFIETGDV